MDSLTEMFKGIPYTSPKKTKRVAKATRKSKTSKSKTSKSKTRPTKKTRKSSARRQKGGKNQPYYYLPVTKGGQLILNSIELDHIRQFLVCLLYSSKLQEWMVSQKKRITLYASGSMFSERIRPFFHTDIPIQNLSKQLDKDVIDFSMTFLQSLWEKDTIRTSTIKEPLSTPIAIKGGQTDDELQRVARTAFAAVALHASVSNPRRTVQIKDTDFRRTIVGIVFPDSGLRCIAKCSNNVNYIEGYKQEATVYRYFESKNEDCVCPFYGGVTGISQRDRRDVKRLSISFPIPIAKTSVLISIPQNRFGESGTPVTAPVYSLITDWNESYCTLEEALKLNISPTLRNRHLQNVMEVTGYLNNKYAFFHGDLKSDNIMVKKDGSNVRCFDFDWSGIIQDIPNQTLLDYFDSNKFKRTVNEFITTPSAKGLCFLLVLDAYRLFVSWIWGLSRTNRFDVFTKKCADQSCVNTIVVQNRFVTFYIQDFVDFLLNIADTKVPKQRTIEYVMTKICKTRKYKIPASRCDDWNSTIMHEDIILQLFIFVMNRAFQRKKTNTR